MTEVYVNKFGELGILLKATDEDAVFLTAWKKLLVPGFNQDGSSGLVWATAEAKETYDRDVAADFWEYIGDL